MIMLEGLDLFYNWLKLIRQNTILIQEGNVTVKAEMIITKVINVFCYYIISLQA